LLPNSLLVTGTKLFITADRVGGGGDLEDYERQRQLSCSSRSAGDRASWQLQLLVSSDRTVDGLFTEYAGHDQLQVDCYHFAGKYASAVAQVSGGPELFSVDYSDRSAFLLFSEDDAMITKSDSYRNCHTV
jgi:hypothetical protein